MSINEGSKSDKSKMEVNGFKIEPFTVLTDEDEVLYEQANLVLRPSPFVTPLNQPLGQIMYQPKRVLTKQLSNVFATLKKKDKNQLSQSQNKHHVKPLVKKSFK